LLASKEDEMGVENNNAVIATTWNREEVNRIKNFVAGLERMQSLFLFGDEEINGRTTVVMVPDGSREGWPNSDEGDKLRDLFVAELEKANYVDGSSPWNYVEVEFGEFEQKVLRGNCKKGQLSLFI
jgi:hypothetical protein